MKPIAILLLSILAAAGTAFLVLAVSPSAPRHAEPAPIAVGPDTRDLARSLDELKRQNAEFQHALDELRMEVAAKSTPTRVTALDVEAAVARALEARGANPLGRSSDAPVTSAAPKVDTRDLLAKLLAPDMTWDKAQALWTQAADAGVLKDLVALYEERARQFPNDPKAHTELGKAYLQLTQRAGNGPEAGVWGTKADKEFDKALALDDHDWSARFTKAVSLSFWPPALGKQGEAISHFETLVRQQEELPVQSNFSETYVFLGNMYAQTGEKAKAVATYQQGLTLFPDNAELKKRLELLQAH